MSAAVLFSADTRREWTAYRAILMHAVNQRRAQGSLWLTWLLMVLALSGIVWASMASAKWWAPAVAFGLGVPLGMLLLFWWMMWIGSVVAQCNPIAMHLAPAMRARARRVTIAVWAMITIAMTLAIGVPTGYPGQVAVFIGIALIEVTAPFSFLRIGAPFAANWLMLHSGPEVANWYWTFLKSDGAVALGMLLLFLDGRFALRRLFGGPRHLPPAIEAASKQDIPASIARTTRFFQAIAGDDARGQPLIARVLGPGTFGGERLILVLLVAVCAVMRGWIAVRGEGAAHEALFGTRCAVLVAMLILQELIAFSVAGSFGKHTSEQALIRLAPAAPPSRSLNRVLARFFLLRFGTTWCIFSALTLGALATLGANAGELARATAACSFALLLAAVPLTDHARRGDYTPRTKLIHLVFAGGFLLAAVAAISGTGSAGQWGAATLASLVAAGLLTSYRWRAMVAAPPAFPAGRLN